jgi:excisionase family DNA binding protein
MSDDLISVKEAAEIIGISRQAVLQAINAGHIEARKVGRDYGMARSEAENYRQRRERRQADKGE